MKERIPIRKFSKGNWPVFFATAACLLTQTPSYASVDTRFGQTLIQKPNINQDKITGVIRDANGLPLQGVSITTKSNSAAITSDLNGKFSINAAEGSILIFSHIAYITQELKVGEQHNITIVMQSDPQKIGEVVVVGYGRQKKINLTGAVSSINGDVLMRRPVTNVASMLQGQTPGLRVVQGSGEPGNENISMRIRGQGTFSKAGNNPLILIDGVEGSLNDLNPNDIENVSVLKDASSAAIYGSRAANGVIIVTTKTGKAGKTVVDLSSNLSIHTPSRLFDLITNSADYMQLWNEAKLNTGINSGLYTQEMIDLYRNATDRIKYPNTNWLDEMIGNATVQQHNLGISGGGENSQYNLSLGYVDQPGVMRGVKYKRYNVRLNLTSKVNDWLKIGAIISGKQGDTQRPRQGTEDTFIGILSQAPTYRPKLPDGRYTAKAYEFETSNKNTVALVENEVFYKNRDYSINLQGWMDVQLVKGLNWYSKAAIVSDFDKESDWQPDVSVYNYHTGERMSNLDVGGKGLTNTRKENRYINIFSYLKYDKTFAEHHNLGLQIGYSQESNRSEYLRGYRRDFFNNTLTQLDAGTNAVQNSGGSAYEWALRSYFARLNYNYKERYLLEANIRRDGSSRFHKDNRWGSFPSLSAAWRVTEEPFLKESSIKWLNDLKIRGSYGTLGNQNINIGDGYPYPYQEIADFTGNYPFDNSVISGGAAQTALSIPSLTWETTKMADIGLDIRMFKNLDITIDWYRKTSTDILRQAQLTGLVGLGAPYVNSGTMRNQGIEFNLNYSNNITTGIFEGLHYSIGGNIDRFKNTTVKLGAREPGGYTIKEEGRPWDQFYMLEWIGIFQNEAEIKNAPKQFNDDTVPGDLRYKDQNGDGLINSDDRTYLDGQFPSFEYAVNGNVTWKNFDLSLMFQGVEGRRIYATDWGTIPFVQGSPPTVNWLDRWTPENPSTTMPRIYWGSAAPEKIKRVSSYFLQDASYLRLKNFTLGYTLPASTLQRMGISKLRIFFSGDNLFTKTNYPGLDPERASSGRFLTYPQNKIYAFGFNVQF